MGAKLSEPRYLVIASIHTAEFLMKLGLPRKEAALIVGSSDESLRVLARQKVKRGAISGKKAK